MFSVLRQPRALVAISALGTSAFAASRLAMSGAAAKPATEPIPRPYVQRHKVWPYAAKDFARQDESDDASFYASPRYVTHIDDHAIATLQQYYAKVLPRRGRILDFCSSWISHYPKEIQDAADQGHVQVIGMGMSEKELAKNAILTDRIVQDLNVQPTVEVRGDQPIDAATCVVSIDYLTQPTAVLSSLRQRMATGGTVHLVISNRCFPTKAVGRWLRVSQDERLQMVGDYLWFSGWRDIQILELTTGAVDSGSQAGGASGFMSWFGMGGTDPLWVVRGSQLDH